MSRFAKCAAVFCNLTEVAGRASRLERYLDALHDEALEVRRSLPRASFAQMAIGGGTPTILPLPALERVLDIAAATGADSRLIPCSVEMSPATVDDEKLALLRSRGVSRVSIGVQSFEAAEVRSVLRPQNAEVVRRALSAIAAAGFPAFNVDLIYGLPGQTNQTFAKSIEAAVDHGVTELYLYPLYVRPHTSLGKRGTEWPDLRRHLYTRARDLLRSRGFVQCSMRRFRSPSAMPDPVTLYRCQNDGMVGLRPRCAVLHAAVPLFDALCGRSLWRARHHR
jgi:oxygen-independent coproporphyrinogen-3 oxidase